MGHFLQQMPNISLLHLSYLDRDSPRIGTACCAAMEHVNQSTLKFLRMSISGLDHVEFILERFTGLLTVTFRSTSTLLTPTTILNHLTIFASKFSFLPKEDSVSVWIGKRGETPIQL